MNLSMLILLDIDGVLVPAAGWKIPPALEDGFPAFTQKSVWALNRLLATGAGVVLTTSHRDRFKIGEWNKIFEARGVHLERLHVLSSNHRSKKENILEWLNVNGITDDFIIIDDDTTLNSLPHILKSHLILTSPLIGLTMDHLDQVDKINSLKLDLDKVS